MQNIMNAARRTLITLPATIATTRGSVSLSDDWSLFVGSWGITGS